MIDELKLLLDQMKNVPDMALWIMGGFLFYKLVTYLSLTGSFVYVVKMLCQTTTDWHQKPKKISYGHLIIDEKCEIELQDLIKSMRTTRFIHSSDIKHLQNAWNEYKDKHGSEIG